MKVIHDCSEIVLCKDTFTYSRIYEAHQFPYLLTLINRLLQEDATVLEEIWSPNLELEQSSKRHFEQPVEEDKRQQSIKNYYLMLQNLITIILIDRISIEEVKRVFSFYGKPIPSEVKSSTFSSIEEYMKQGQLANGTQEPQEESDTIEQIKRIKLLRRYQKS